jgi:nicotinamidase/pyrazinamidase
VSVPFLFWDVDTQVDFMLPDGKLYIHGAETIQPQLATIIDVAKKYGIPVFGSVDYHAPEDAELAVDPDFNRTFPPHCLAGSPGAEKVDASIPGEITWLDGQDPWPGKPLPTYLYLRKQRFDVFSNPHMSNLLSSMQARNLIVFGVALDVCVAHAIDGFLQSAGFTGDIYLLTDATRAIQPQRGAQMLERWQKNGVKLIETSALQELIEKKSQVYSKLN